jgi:hypothetical protein
MGGSEGRGTAAASLACAAANAINFKCAAGSLLSGRVG